METTRQELTNEEIEQLGRHAGELARKEELMQLARKEANKKAQEEIGVVTDELAVVHKWLREGCKDVPAQGQMFDADGEMDPSSAAARLEQARRVVRQTREELSQPDDGAEF